MIWGIWLAVGGTMYLRLLLLWRFWSGPQRIDRDRFYGVKIDPEMLRHLLRRYRVCIFIPLTFDLAVLAVIVWMGRLDVLLFEQIAATIISLFFEYIVAFHFAARARLAEASNLAPAARSVSLEVRQLRDFTSWPVEAVVACCTLGGLAVLVTAARTWWKPLTDPFVIWLIYATIGLPLFKSLVVHARMQLPATRTDDFRRWRSAWIRFHLQIVDFLRLVIAVMLLCGTLLRAGRHGWHTAQTTLIAIAVFTVGVVAMVVFAVRARRAELRLVALQKEIKLLELFKDVPASPIADGRFLAGGFLFVNRDYPAMLVRSPSGLAINLASSTTYAWAAYLSGLVLIVALQFAR